MNKQKLIILFICFGALAGVITGLVLLADNEKARLWAKKRFAPPQTSSKPAIKPKKIHFNEQLLAAIKALETKKENIKVTTDAQNSRISIRAAVPLGLPIESILSGLMSTVENTAYKVNDCYYLKKKNAYAVSFVSRRRGQPKILLTLTRSGLFYSKTAQLAIIVDNFSFEADKMTVDFLSFAGPLTISLQAHAKRSSWTAQIAQEYNKEIIIQIPLEPKRKMSSRNAASMIMVHYSEDKIKKMFAELTKKITYFSGFSNFMGERALQDRRVMNVIIEEIRKRDGYFIEKGSLQHSVAPELTAKSGIPYARIQGYLQTAKKSSEEIAGQLQKYAATAQSRGKLIIGAHATRNFIKVLKDNENYLKHNGIQLVHVSRLIK